MQVGKRWGAGCRVASVPHSRLYSACKDAFRFCFPEHGANCVAFDAPGAVRIAFSLVLDVISEMRFLSAQTLVSSGKRIESDYFTIEHDDN